jgi:tetratricopeptide (TPR) repeat protein
MKIRTLFIFLLLYANAFAQTCNTIWQPYQTTIDSLNADKKLNAKQKGKLVDSICNAIAGSMQPCTQDTIFVVYLRTRSLACRRLKQYKKTEHYLLQALSVKGITTNTKNELIDELATAKYYLGYATPNNTPLKMKYHTESDSLFNTITSKTMVYYILNVNELADCFSNKLRSNDAIILCEKSIKAAHKYVGKIGRTAEEDLLATTWENYYQSLLTANRYKEARIALDSLENRKKNGKDDFGIAEVHAWRAHDLIDRGKMKEADAELDKGFLIFKQKNKTSDGVYAELLRNKAKWCYTIFDYQTALRYADSAINVTNRPDFKTVSILEKAKPLNQKARILSKLERYTEALQVQDEVLKIDTAANALQDIQHAYHVAALAEIYYEKRDFEKAIHLYKAALKIDAPFGKTNRMAYLPHLFALAQAEYDTKNYTEARLHTDTLLLGYQKETGKNSDYAQAAILRARTLQATQKHEQAAQEYIAALALLQQEYRLLLTELSEKQQTDLQAVLRQTMAYFYTLPIAILQKHTSTLYDLQLQNKAILLNIYQTQQRMAAQIAEKDPAVAALLNDLNALRQNYTQALTLQNTQNSTALKNQIEAKEAELHKRLPSVFEDKSLRNIGWRDIKKRL